MTIAAVPLGIARAALDGVRELSTSKTPRIGSTLLRERPVVQGAMGRAEAMLGAARAFLFEACDEAWSTVASGAELTLEQRAKVRLSCAQVADIAKSVVRIAYDSGLRNLSFAALLPRRTRRSSTRSGPERQFRDGWSCFARAGAWYTDFLMKVQRYQLPPVTA